MLAILLKYAHGVVDFNSFYPCQLNPALVDYRVKIKLFPFEAVTGPGYTKVYSIILIVEACEVKIRSLRDVEGFVFKLSRFKTK